MKIIGTASHFKNITASNPIASKMIFGISFFREKLLNFKAIIGSLLTINQLSTAINTYNTHLFISHSLTLIKLLP